MSVLIRCKKGEEWRNKTGLKIIGGKKKQKALKMRFGTFWLIHLKYNLLVVCKFKREEYSKAAWKAIICFNFFLQEVIR